MIYAMKDQESGQGKEIDRATHSPSASSSGQCIPPWWPCKRTWRVLGPQGCDGRPAACRWSFALPWSWWSCCCCCFCCRSLVFIYLINLIMHQRSWPHRHTHTLESRYRERERETHTHTRVWGERETERYWLIENISNGKTLLCEPHD